MANQFSLNYPGDKKQLLEKIKNAAGSKGQFAGNESQGSFEGDTPLGKFAGSYSIQGDTINITIDKKPFLLSHGMIKDEFEKALKKA
ncbi:hypothetical protein [Flavobacterium sp. AG291]|uniref:hypothetical protein n=1 Tax=Flavobacterium sp. AG291 TaxID=2184000 RepID=UPI0011C04F35|nr:hypothetical protein [Flavobacterium sp. AG291]